MNPIKIGSKAFCLLCVRAATDPFFNRRVEMDAEEQKELASSALVHVARYLNIAVSSACVGKAAKNCFDEKLCCECIRSSEVICEALELGQLVQSKIFVMLTVSRQDMLILVRKKTFDEALKKMTKDEREQLMAFRHDYKVKAKEALLSYVHDNQPERDDCSLFTYVGIITGATRSKPLAVSHPIPPNVFHAQLQMHLDVLRFSVSSLDMQQRDGLSTSTLTRAMSAQAISAQPQQQPTTAESSEQSITED